MSQNICRVFTADSAFVEAIEKVSHPGNWGRKGRKGLHQQVQKRIVRNWALIVKGETGELEVGGS